MRNRDRILRHEITATDGQMVHDSKTQHRNFRKVHRQLELFVPHRIKDVVFNRLSIQEVNL